MYKLALVGGESIRQYTVADKLWQILGERTQESFQFEVIPLKDENEAKQFFQNFINDDSFRGFNIALPWKSLFAGMVDEVITGDQLPIINTVYKSGKRVLGDNTDPLGVVASIRLRHDMNEFKRCLILGAGGAGTATAHYLSSQLKIAIYIFDTAAPSLGNVDGINVLSGLEELSTHKYDLIVNATPRGKYYLATSINNFESPLDRDLLRKVSLPHTVVQEMNYMPRKTLLLQLAESLQLETIPGEAMLVAQALESMQRYFGRPTSRDLATYATDAIATHIKQQESAILKLKQGAS